MIIAAGMPISGKEPKDEKPYPRYLVVSTNFGRSWQKATTDVFLERSAGG